jgi:hypothetical protein
MMDRGSGTAWRTGVRTGKKKSEGVNRKLELGVVHLVRKSCLLPFYTGWHH